MNMLEKLGIKCPVDEIKSVGDCRELYEFLGLEKHPLTAIFKDAVILLKQRKEWEQMLEALIESLAYQIELLECELHRDWKNCSCTDCGLLRERITIIESLTNLKWSDIEDRLKE